MGLDRIRGLLVDLSGVLYVEDEPIEGAPEAIAELRRAGIGLAFVTNTTADPRSAVHARLHGMGIEVAERELLTPAALARDRCRERGYERVALLVADGLREDLPGLTEEEEAPEAVILGDLGEGFDFALLNRAFRMLMDGAELIALQRNRYWRSAEGLVLDLGPFVAALEYAAGREATVMGKPSTAFYELALAAIGVQASEAAIVGDDVEADVGGALDTGMAGILVRTGKYEPGAAERTGVQPTATVDSIADLPALLGL